MTEPTSDLRDDLKRFHTSVARREKFAAVYAFLTGLAVALTPVNVFGLNLWTVALTVLLIACAVVTNTAIIVAFYARAKERRWDESCLDDDYESSDTP